MTRPHWRIGGTFVLLHPPLMLLIWYSVDDRLAVLWRNAELGSVALSLAIPASLLAGFAITIERRPRDGLDLL